MRKKIGPTVWFFGVVVLFVGLVFGVLRLATGTARAEPIPTKAEVYFVTLGSSGSLVAYVPGHSVGVAVKIDASVTKPYVEVARISNNGSWETNEKEFTAWGLGGTLHVKDREQLEKLLLR